MITVYALAYNEEYMLPFFIEHYRICFPDCRIIIYDNQSIDRTVQIATENKCEVRTFVTGNTLSDRTYLEIKNNCWKDAKTDWVLICDVDEHCEVTDSDLARELITGVTMLQFKGFNMINQMDEMQSPFDIKHGIRAESYDKKYCFRKSAVQEINYSYGCHRSSPIPRGGNHIVLSAKEYVCRHYKYLNLNYMIERHGGFAKRMSDYNKKHGLGAHYLYTPQEITKEFNEARAKAYVI